MEEKEIPLDIDNMDTQGTPSPRKLSPKLIGIIIGGCLVFIIILIIILVVCLNSDDEKEVLGEINCIYDINDISIETDLVGNNFVKNSDFDMFIDDIKIDYSNKYKFENTGEHKVKFVLYNELRMNYMFQDIKALKKVEMESNKNLKILSMESTFENCEQLELFNISGFDGNDIPSMAKLFYNSNIKEIYFSNFPTNNVKNMSYSFASTNLVSLDLSMLDLSKVEDMSFMFTFCLSLNNLNLSNINAKEVKNTSYMFYDCESLNSLDISHFETEKLEDMSYMFYSCESLVSLDLSSIDTKNVINMTNTFNNCLSLINLIIFLFININ